MTMTSMEEDGIPAAEEVPAGNPDDLAKNPAALKGKCKLLSFAYSYELAVDYSWLKAL